jgi:Spy/CpxP family protein refolding chaperone
MYPLRSKLLTGAAVTLLATVCLFAQQARREHAQQHFQAMAQAANFTPDQANQAHSIFQEAGRSAKPVRQELRQTRQQLRAAVQAGDQQQIQQLTATEGAQRGQLAAIRATSMSKVYKILTPDQQQKLMAFQATRHGGKKAPGVQN